MFIGKVILKRLLLQAQVVIVQVFEIFTLDNLRLFFIELVVLIQEIGEGNVSIVQVCQGKPIVGAQKVPIRFLALVKVLKTLLEHCQVLNKCLI